MTEISLNQFKAAGQSHLVIISQENVFLSACRGDFATLPIVLLASGERAKKLFPFIIALPKQGRGVQRFMFSLSKKDLPHQILRPIRHQHDIRTRVLT